MFGEYAAQAEVFEVVGQPLAEEVLKGFNATIFAYGQSGTGKTFTMEGGDWDGATLGDGAGLIPRAVAHMFGSLAHLPADSYALKVSFLEIYNEELVDLLAPGKVRSRGFRGAAHPPHSTNAQGFKQGRCAERAAAE